MESITKMRMRILRVGEEAEVKDVEFKPNPKGYESPGLDQLRTLIEPLLGGEPMEHVAVLWNGRRNDMFVSELGHVPMTTRPPLPRNEAATIIYRNNTLRRNPNCNPESLHWIAGTAILFEDRVWF